MQVVLKIAIAISDKAIQSRLMDELTQWTIEENHESDIALYGANFELLKKRFGDINIAFIDCSILEINRNNMKSLYYANTKCLIVLLGAPPECVCKYLELRPGGYLSAVLKYDTVGTLCNNFIDELLYQACQNDTWLISTRQGCYAIPFNDILYCQSDLKYIEIITRTKKKYRKVEKLDNIVAKLPSQFLRIHQSYIVNTNYVREYNKAEKTLILFNGITIPISRAYTNIVNIRFSELYSKNTNWGTKYENTNF